MDLIPVDYVTNLMIVAAAIKSRFVFFFLFGREVDTQSRQICIFRVEFTQPKISMCGSKIKKTNNVYVLYATCIVMYGGNM